MKRDYIYLLIIAVLLAVIFCSTESSNPQMEESVTKTTRTDSATFYHPDPITLDYRTERVQVPRWLFSVSEIPTGSVDVQEDTYPNTDSVEVAVNIETRTYRDSTFEAQVSGPSIGSYRPTLDYVHTFCNTQEVTRTIFVQPRKWWEVRATAGALFTPDNADLWVGLSTDRHTGRWSYGASVGYSLSGEPIVEARAGFRILSKTQIN